VPRSGTDETVRRLGWDVRGLRVLNVRLRPRGRSRFMANERYALLVVDMQNGFCHPDGSFPRIGRGLEGAMDAVAKAAMAVAQARAADVPVVFTRHVYRPGRPDEGAALIRNSPELAGVAGLADGTWDAEVCAELGCGPDDLLVSPSPCSPTAARRRPAACTSSPSRYSAATSWPRSPASPTVSTRVTQRHPPAASNPRSLPPPSGSAGGRSRASRAGTGRGTPARRR